MDMMTMTMTMGLEHMCPVTDIIFLQIFSGGAGGRVENSSFFSIFLLLKFELFINSRDNTPQNVWGEGVGFPPTTARS